MLDISSISGDVALVYSAGQRLTLEYSSISGGFQCDFSVLMQEKQVVAGDGAGKYHIDTASEASAYRRHSECGPPTK
jgi:hypothetical protein